MDTTVAALYFCTFISTLYMQAAVAIMDADLTEYTVPAYIIIGFGDSTYIGPCEY